MEGDYYEDFGFSQNTQDLIENAVYDSLFTATDQDTVHSTDGKPWLTQNPRQNATRPFENPSLFPNENSSTSMLFPEAQIELTWSMPGAFRTADHMDLDESPPFTVELDVYFDAKTPTMVDERGNSGLTPTMFEDKIKQDEPAYEEGFGMPPENGSFAFEAESLELRGNDARSYNFQMHQVDEGYHTVKAPIFSFNSASNVGVCTQSLPDNARTDGQMVLDTYTPDISENAARNASIATPEEVRNIVHSGIERRDLVRHRASLLVQGTDLLPLTTTTSLTPSLSSLHLTQPSFFSANQFVRSLFDQPPSLVHRPSIDLYSRQRLSIDSQPSAPIVQNTSRSFSSYIPFMGDRDREHKQPGAVNGADWNQLGIEQPRHLIRSIFKSNNPVPEIGDPVDHPPDAMLTDTYQQEQLGMIQEDTSKKSKRPRRSLFTRLRSTKSETEKQENSFSEELKSELHESENSMKPIYGGEMNSNTVEANEFFRQNVLTPTPSKLSTLEAELTKSETQNSSRSNEREQVPGFVSKPNSTNQAFDDSQTPDYGALFQGVGKRRNLVGMKSKKLKADVSVKSESIKQEPDLLTEKLSLNIARSSNDDGHLSQSLTFSQASSISNESNLDAQVSNGGSSFASASKRILGSRLLKRKGNTLRSEPQVEPQTEALSDVVEIDLKSLDLPANTEILPQIDPKSRTRGRKEDKAADMEDQTKVFVCGYCTRRFKRQEHLKRHFRSLHTSEKPYECQFCQKKFSRTDNLNQHLKVHKQEDGELLGEQSDE